MENKKKRRQKGKKPANQAQNPQNMQRQERTERSERRQHVVLDELPVPQVVEPRPACVLCGQPIETFAEAISEPNGGYSHFDCVLEKIRQQEQVQEPDSVSYIGHGTFAVVTKDAEGKYSIKTRIPYESADSFNGMKKQVEAAKQ